MENIAQLDEFLSNVFRFTAQYSFDKAKDICRKEKIMTNQGIYKDLLIHLSYMIGVEKSYSEMGFIAIKSKVAIKKDNTLKSAYLEIKSECDKIVPDEAEYERILKEIINWTEIRSQMIDFYNKMYTTATYNKHLKMQEFIDTLRNIVNTSISPYAPKTLVNMKILIEFETSCLLDLMYAQYFLENWNLVSCTSHISSAKSKLAIWENTLQNKETWRLNFLRMNTVPELYRWLMKFKTFLLEKFSVYFYMIMRQQTSASDLKTICGKHRLEFLQKFQSLTRKCGHETTSLMLVFDACGIKNWHGPGYRCPLKNTKSESPSSSYYVMLRHPEKLGEPFNVMPTIRRILVEHFSDILFLDRVVCRYISEENSTYFITSIEEKISLVAYYNSKKDDKQCDIDNYILELAWMIRSHRVFLSLNSNSSGLFPGFAGVDNPTLISLTAVAYLVLMLGEINAFLYTAEGVYRFEISYQFLCYVYVGGTQMISWYHRRLVTAICRRLANDLPAFMGNAAAIEAESTFKRLVNTIGVGYWITMGLYVSAPWINFALQKFNFDDPKSYPMPFWFAAIKIESVAEYMVMNILQTIICSMVFAVYSCSFGFIICVMINLKAHLREIRRRTEAFGGRMELLFDDRFKMKYAATCNEDKNELYRRYEDVLVAEFVQIVRYKQVLYVYAKDVVAYLRSIFNAALVWCIAEIVMTTYMATQINADLVFKMKILSVVTNVTGSFLLFCYVAETVSHINEKCMWYFYDIPWYLDFIKIRKVLSTLLLQSQGMIEIKPFKMYTMNLILFSRSLRVIYSLLNFLLLMQR